MSKWPFKSCCTTRILTAKKVTEIPKHFDNEEEKKEGKLCVNITPSFNLHILGMCEIWPYIMTQKVQNELKHYDCVILQIL